MVWPLFPPDLKDEKQKQNKKPPTKAQKLFVLTQAFFKGTLNYKTPQKNRAYTVTMFYYKLDAKQSYNINTVHYSKKTEVIAPYDINQI